MTLPEDKGLSDKTSQADSPKVDSGKGKQRPPLSWAERASRASTRPEPPAPKETELRVPLARSDQKSPDSAPGDKPAPPVVPGYALATKEKPVVVLDAGALLRVDALDRFREKCMFVTTAEAAQEVRDALARRRIGERFLDIRTVQPSSADLGWAQKFSEMTGDLPFLSGTDLGIIALTYMLQRATGRTERLKLRPPAFEFFNEAEFQSKLESDGCSKHLWTLQKANAGNGPPGRPEHRERVSEKAVKWEGELPGDAESVQSASDVDDSGDDMDEEEGWVTEDVLRDHLGLIGEGNSQKSSGDAESNSDAPTDALCNAFSGLELRAHLQEVEDLVSCMTTDFSIQNVLMQMGLDVLAVDGKKIRTVKVWALLCRWVATATARPLLA